jgi:hypothetical protein
MAKSNVNDPSSLVNNSPETFSHIDSPEPSVDITTLYPDDYLLDILAKARALVVVGQFGGIYGRAEDVQFQYLSVLNSLLENLRHGLEKNKSKQEGKF